MTCQINTFSRPNLNYTILKVNFIQLSILRLAGFYSHRFQWGTLFCCFLSTLKVPRVYHSTTAALFSMNFLIYFCKDTNKFSYLQIKFLTGSLKLKLTYNVSTDFYRISEMCLCIFLLF